MIPAAIDLDLLRSYVAVVRQGSLTRAAAVICRSQPTLSTQMRRLEALLGVTLLKRTGRGVVATPDGEVFLGYATRMLSLGDEAMIRLQGTSEVQGVVRIGLPEEIIPQALSSVVGHVRLKHPQVRLDVVVDDTTRNGMLWRDGALDVMIGVPSLMPTDEAVPASTWTIDLEWVCGFGYAPAEGEPLDLLVFPEPCAWRRRMIQALDTIGQPWRIAFTSRSIPAVQTAVENGLGATVLPAQSVHRSKMRPLPEALSPLKPLAVPYGLYARSDEQPATKAVLNALLRWMSNGMATAA
ncbi:LysR substrate-binding domain-containing protein [Aureimonas ureilytica]|uniref:LysR substrate-binding domain-containing protein n=1 Tax=Aureimonas ureilytica TaxID=401562 RepID=UPI0003729084|nr:LysR substrate-binding domain-containing protein [Aureimonas ureilytica]